MLSCYPKQLFKTLLSYPGLSVTGRRCACGRLCKRVCVPACVPACVPSYACHRHLCSASESVEHTFSGPSCNSFQAAILACCSCHDDATSVPKLLPLWFRCHDNFTLDFNADGMDKELYMATVTALLHFSRNVLSTESMARYVLARIQERGGGFPIKTVLFLMPGEHCDCLCAPPVSLMLPTFPALNCR